MTILQGTMQDGTVIPVQVDSQGRLVAEGLEGAPGPAGPAGPAGGTFDLPPNPPQGAVLGWVNGGLAWIDAVLKPPQSEPILSVAATPARNFESTMTSDNGWYTPPGGAFDGTNGGCSTQGGGTMTWSAGTFNLSGHIRIGCGVGFGSPHRQRWVLSGARGTFDQVANDVVNNGVVDVGDLGVLSTFQIQGLTSGTGAGFLWIEIGGRRLISGESHAVLTLSGPDKLDQFRVGEVVTEVGGGEDAYGVVESVDLVSLQLVVTKGGGTWNVGSRVTH